MNLITLPCNQYMKDVYHDTIYQLEKSHWWYRVRREMVHTLIQTYFLNKAPLRILDMGCGTGALLSELSPYGDAHGIDVSPRAVAFCRERGVEQVRVGSVTNIAYPDATFDLVVALDVIEHVSDDKKAIEEIKRVLKPGGIAILFVPAFMFLWGSTDVFSEHYRRYTRQELRAKLTAANFLPIRFSYFNTFLFPPIALWRLLNRIIPLHSNSETELNNPLVNSLLYAVFRSELSVLRFVNFPFGVSVLAVVRKT